MLGRLIFNLIGFVLYIGFLHICWPNLKYDIGAVAVGWFAITAIFMVGDYRQGWYWF